MLLQTNASIDGLNCFCYHRSVENNGKYHFDRAQCIKSLSQFVVESRQNVAETEHTKRKTLHSTTTSTASDAGSSSLLPIQDMNPSKRLKK